MRHFVTNIACGKNEFVDKSALRYAEPVKLYLAALRNGHDAEKREDNAVCETASSARSAEMSLGSEALTSQDAAEGSEPSDSISASSHIKLPLSRFRARLRYALASRSLPRMTDSMLVAMKASEAQDWSRAESLWQAALDESGGRTPSAAYRHLVRACRHRSNYRKAEKIARQGLRRYPKHAGLNVDLAEIAIAGKDWDQASQCADTIFELFEAKPERVRLYCRSVPRQHHRA